MSRRKQPERVPENDGTLKYKIRFRIYKSDLVFGPGVAELMRLVDETGSLSEACRRMDMAYSKGWKIIRRAEKDLGFQIMKGTRGGENGGQTSLTEAGRDVLRRYVEMQADLKVEADRLFARHFDGLLGDRQKEDPEDEAADDLREEE